MVDGRISVRTARQAITQPRTTSSASAARKSATSSTSGSSSGTSLPKGGGTSAAGRDGASGRRSDARSRTLSERLLHTPTPLSQLVAEAAEIARPRARPIPIVAPGTSASPFPEATLDGVMARSGTSPLAKLEPADAPGGARGPGAAPETPPGTDAATAPHALAPTDRQTADEIVDGVRSDIDAADEVVERAGESPFDIIGKDPLPDELGEHVLDAATTLERIDEIEDPAVREQVLRELAPEIERLGELLPFVGHKPAVDSNTPASQITDSLTRTTESLGIDQADLLAEPLAQGLERSLTMNDESMSRTRLFGESIEAGHGALLATRLTRFVDVDSDAYQLLSTAALGGIGSVNADFDRALEAKREVDFLVAQFVHEWGDVLSEQELQDGIDAIWEDKADVVAELEAQSERLATLFDGVGSLEPDGRPGADGAAESELWAEVENVRANLEPFAYTAFGQEYLARGIEASAAGETNFVTHIRSFAQVIDSGVGNADTVANLVVRTVAARASVHIRNGDIDSAVELFEGLEHVADSRVLGFNDPAELEKLTGLLEDFGNGEIEPGEFADLFSEQAGKIDGRAGRDDTSNFGTAFKLLGISVGVAALVADGRGADGVEDYLALANDGAGLLGEIGSVLPSGSTAAEFLGKLGKLAKVGGPVFDTLAVVHAFNAGDVAQAGIAFAGLVGGLLVGSSSVGPVGTAIGAVLAAGALVGGFALDIYRRNEAEDDVEELFGKALEAAGFTEEEADLLRDVSGDTRRSIGLIFSQLAASHPDIDARDLLDSFLDPGTAHGGVGASTAVDGEGRLHTDNRRELIDLIEDLPRHDNGNFTEEAVREAALLFELELGIAIDPSGLDAETALDAFEARFDELDLDGDGQVSTEELERIVEDHDAQGDYFGIPTQTPSDRPYVPDRLADLARYLLAREGLIDRLDVGGEGGRGNGRISRDDIAAVRAQDEALRVVRENREVFDTAHQGDPGEADQEISRDDLIAVSEGDHPQELKDAAELLLEDEGFFRVVDSARPEDLDTTTPDDGLGGSLGDGKLTFEELAIATSATHGVTAG